MKKLGIITIVSVLFLMSSVLGFEISANSPNYVVSQGELVRYDFTVKNAYDSSYSITTSSENARWMTMPGKIYPKEGTDTFQIYINVPRNAFPGKHGFEIIIRSDSNPSDVVTETVYVFVKSKDGIQINEIKSQYGNYKSDEPITMNLNVMSNEPLERDIEFVFDIKNPQGEIIKTSVLNVLVPADRESNYQQSFVFGQLAPGKYPVEVTVKNKKDGYIFDKEQGYFEVTSLVDLSKDKKSSWTFLAVKSVIRVHNLGNAPATDVEVTDTVPLFWSWFVKDSSEYQKSSTGSDVSYTWKLTSVEAQGTKEVSYRIILWPIYLVVFALALVGFKSYTTFMVPAVTKSFNSRVSLGEGKEGSVVISAKNKSLRTLRNVVIQDKVPSSFKILDSSLPRPKYRKTGSGFDLRWDLGTLAPGEERVFSYKIKNLLGIIGTVELPKAEMRAEGNRSYRSTSPKARGDLRKKPV